MVVEKESTEPALAPEQLQRKKKKGQSYKKILLKIGLTKLERKMVEQSHEG